jgi:phosphonopyruvate decarboxylase
MVASEISKIGKSLNMFSLTSQSFIKCLIHEGYKFFTGVPCSLLSGLIYELEGQKEARYIPAVREDAAVGLCTGAYLAGIYRASFCASSSSINPDNKEQGTPVKNL